MPFIQFWNYSQHTKFIGKEIKWREEKENNNKSIQALKTKSVYRFNMMIERTFTACLNEMKWNEIISLEQWQ